MSAATVVAVDLAADFAARPEGAVNIHIRGTSANRGDQFVNFAGVDALSPGACGGRDVRTNIGRNDRSGYRCRWSGAGLSSGWAVAEIGAEEYAYAAIHALLSKVNMSLLDSAFEIRIGKFPVDSRFIIADAGIEGAITGRRD